MNIYSAILPADADRAGARQPPIGQLLLIFWGMFAASLAISAALNPGFFTREDPDSLMRLVQVRDLLAGQGWFDLIQHRLDPPAGASMHWSRLIDAPIAGLVILGDLFGAGERFALLAWPLLLLLAFMGGAVAIATALGGGAAAVPTLLLALVFFDPLLSFLPGDLDHHNAQLAILLASVAAVLRMRDRPIFGFAAGFLCGLSLAVGLEMLVFIAAIGAFVALRWAASGEGGRSVGAFGLAFGASPLPLYLLAGAPGAAMACDALSPAYLLPAAAAGFGLAAASLAGARAGATSHRVLGLTLIGAATAAIVLLAAPDCLAGPYAGLSPELKRLWLNTITEARPLLDMAAHEPVAIIANVGPSLVALVVALRRLGARGEPERAIWIVPALLIGLALLLSLYQVRTLPVANAASIPVLGSWLAALAARHGVTALRPIAQARPVILAVLLCIPLVHLALGWGAVRLLTVLSGGRIAPIERPDTPKHLTAGLSEAERLCLDPASAALLAAVPTGIVMAPVFYGPTVLAISGHSVVAAPYHRAGAAILDAIHAMDLPPPKARAVIERRAADYVAICLTARETALTAAEAPGGLLARLQSGDSFDWLEPVSPVGTGGALRVWRVLD